MTVSALAWQCYQLWIEFAHPKPVPLMEQYTRRVEDKIDMLVDTINNIPTRIFAEIYRAIKLENKYVNLILVLVALLALVYWLCKLLVRLFRKSYMTLHHISDFRGEAMVDGSPFFDGETPDCQVKLYETGPFGLGKFLGCGLRYQNVLVAPIHVIKNNKEIGIEGKSKSALVGVRVIPSSIHTDVCYMYVPEKVWSLIGTTSFKYNRPPLSSTVASCAGHKGVSSGTVSPSKQPYSLVYGGSTINGMSGAAYIADKTVLGMHLGRHGFFNMGVTVHLICKEVQSISWGEDTEDTNTSSKPNIPRSHTWSVDDIQDALDSHVDAVSEADKARFKQDTLDRNAWEEKMRKTKQFMWEDDLEGAKPTPYKTKWFRMHNQGPDPEPSTSTGVKVQEEPVRLGDIVRKLMVDRDALIRQVDTLTGQLKSQKEENEARFQKIENHIWPKLTTCHDCGAAVNNIRQHVKNTHQVIRCTCKAEFLSTKALEQHQRDKHQKKSDEIEMQPMGKYVDHPESAVADDSKKKVATSFLEQRLPSPKRSGKSSKKNSSSQEKKQNSPLVAEIQPLLMEFQRSLLEGLQKWQQGMATQSSAATQNSGR